MSRNDLKEMDEQKRSWDGRPTALKKSYPELESSVMIFFGITGIC